MKNLIIYLFCLFPFLLVAQNTNTYLQVALKLDRQDLISYLNQNGLQIDHFHKHGNDELEVIITEEEVLLLDQLEVTYEVEVFDMTAHFQKQLEESMRSRDVACGLDNFDNGSMGGYHTYDNMQTHITSMQSQFPNLVQITEIGTSVEGRTIFAVKISDNVEVDESNVEGVAYYDALTHAREPVGLETVLYYMWSLLENYNSDTELTYLVNNREMYFVPIVNPDGYVFNQMTNPNGGGFWRKNRQDNGGGCFGIDLNRNYSFEWGNPAGSSADPCSDLYHGPEAFSEPETQAVRDFTEMISPSAAFSCHTYSDVFLCPNGFDDNLLQYETYAEFASEFIPSQYRGYGNWVQMINYYGAGTTHDYLSSTGTIAYTPEIGHTFWENPADICDRIQEMFPAMKYMSWVAGDYTCFHDFELEGDGTIWEGHATYMNVRVKNRGLSHTASNVNVALQSSHPAISFTNSNVDLGDIPSRSFADNSNDLFSFTVDNTVVLGEEIAIDVMVYQGGELSYQDVIYVYAGAKEMLLEEDCENGISQWTSTFSATWDTTFMDAFNGGHSITDSRYGNFDSNDQTNIFLNAGVDLSLAEYPYLEFNAKWSLEPGLDYVRLQASTNGGLTWSDLLGTYNGPINNINAYTNNQHWVQERIDLSAYVGESTVQIGFFMTTDNGIQGDGFYFDEFKVVNYSAPGMSAVIDADNDLQMKIYPNPSTDHLIIEPGDLVSNYQIEVFDYQGRQLFTQPASGVLKLSTTDLPNGLYWVKLLQDGLEQMERVVVLHL